MDLSQYNDLSVYGLAWVIPAITAGVGLVRGLFGNKNKQQQQSQTTYNITDRNQGSVTPTYDPFAGEFRNQLIQNASNRSLQPLANPNQLAQTVANQQLQTLGQTGTAQTNLLNSVLRSRGLNNSPMAASALAQQGAGRITESGNILNSIPLLQRQFAQENEGVLNQRQQLAQSLFNMIPYGQYTDMTSTRTGDTKTLGTATSTQGGGLGGALGGAMDAFSPVLGRLYGNWLDKTFPRWGN